MKKNDDHIDGGLESTALACLVAMGAAILLMVVFRGDVAAWMRGAAEWRASFGDSAHAIAGLLLGCAIVLVVLGLPLLVLFAIARYLLRLIRK